jgi:hypothetical protein
MRGTRAPITILAIDHNLKQPVVGYETLDANARVYQWSYDGTFMQDEKTSVLDLENNTEASAF